MQALIFRFFGIKGIVFGVVSIKISSLSAHPMPALPEDDRSGKGYQVAHSP